MTDLQFAESILDQLQERNPRFHGKAYLFLAGALLDTVADIVFPGESADDRLGSALASGFDWDGDAQADLAIGAPQSDRGANNAGGCFIYLGGQNLDATPDAVLAGGAADVQFAGSLSAIAAASHNTQGALLVGDYLTASGRAQLFAEIIRPTDVGTTPGATCARLRPPWPNPFNPQVRSALLLDVPGAWTVTVVDARGRSVAQLLAATLDGDSVETRLVRARRFLRETLKDKIG